jgi:prepilin-type processing-associated H-X9-DG protein
MFKHRQRLTHRPPGTQGADPSQAFTLTDLLIMVACAALMAAALLPIIARRSVHPKRLYCTNNMRQIGLAFRVWAADNGDHLPMQVSVTNGGTLELVASGAVYPHFRVMSNELSTPKVLLCPEDKRRTDVASLLSGDRNITNRARVGSRLVYLGSGAIIAWNKELHSEKGNLGFGDGSVNDFTNSGVPAGAWLRDGSTNRLAVP